MSFEPQQDPHATDDGLRPYRAREDMAEDRDVLDEQATYQDARRPGTVAAAADQPLSVKSRQRMDFAASEEAPEKPRVPWRLTGATWRYSLKRTLAEFSRDQCTDLAAGLTYYAVLSLFPALIAFVSLLSVVGQAQATQDFILETMSELVDEEFMDTVETIVGVVTSAPGAGLGLAVGILVAMWTASNYVNAFSRAMNRIHEVPEGRSMLQLRPVLYSVTVGLIVLVALSAVMLVISGPLAEAIGNTVGLGETAVTVWDYATYPVLLLVAAACVGLLYYATPNVRQPGPLWISPGALVAIVVMVLATIGVGFYIGNFASYEATYGALAGVIIFLFWIYIMNVVLLLGAELDAELERGRQLQAGIEAERTLMLSPRQLKSAEKSAQKYEQLVAQGQALRMSEGRTFDAEDVWRQ
ncbi:YihY/virulence factor BrkB family protein [Nesterenkonia sp. HG001]|uniref:YihY/virulence factor BrkB family protein n=1 Tax=Nesterenkonia sp. HG001 TaxID=2983207 RepID=UPI002AC61291|nr:YihY/virulence factor BrkB family protein [Nesterenkonia sp. HG001]MDZ5076218.1 YihY/virulence factor BrkB family protein [Nesterenkonia sp. HG001]